MNGYDPIQDANIKKNDVRYYAINTCACLIALYVVIIAITSHYTKQHHLSSTIEPDENITTTDPIVTLTQETPLVGESDDYSEIN